MCIFILIVDRYAMAFYTFGYYSFTNFSTAQKKLINLSFPVILIIQVHFDIFWTLWDILKKYLKIRVFSHQETGEGDEILVKIDDIQKINIKIHFHDEL